MTDRSDCVRRLAEAAGISPEANRTFDWQAIEADLGLRLPADYKLIAESFPGGWFRQFVEVWLPDQPTRLLSEFARGELESVREYKATGEGTFPFPLFPDPGGVLPWGYLRSPGLAYWLTGPGDPDDWPLVLATEDGDYWDRFDGPVCEFLIEVVLGRYDASGFPDDYRGHGDHWVDDLPSRTVFEATPPPRPPVPPAPPARPRPSADFWLNRALQLGYRAPVNDMAALREIIGPPTAQPSPVDWSGVHARLGFVLPADYQEFIDSYGPGTLGKVRIMAPGQPPDMDLYTLLDERYGQVRELDVGTVKDVPFYPEAGGTVSWGVTADGRTCAWAPVSTDSGEWTTTVIAAKFRGFKFRPGVSFSTLLRQHAEQDHRGLLPPSDPPLKRVTFKPYRPLCAD